MVFCEHLVILSVIRKYAFHIIGIHNQCCIFVVYIIVQNVAYFFDNIEDGGDNNDQDTNNHNCYVANGQIMTFYLLLTTDDIEEHVPQIPNANPSNHLAEPNNVNNDETSVDGAQFSDADEKDDASH